MSYMLIFSVDVRFQYQSCTSCFQHLKMAGAVGSTWCRGRAVQGRQSGHFCNSSPADVAVAEGINVCLTLIDTSHFQGPDVVKVKA